MKWIMACVLMLAGCSSELDVNAVAEAELTTTVEATTTEPPTTTTEATTTSTDESALSETALSYFDGVVEPTEDSSKAPAADFAEPESSAWAYAAYLADIRLAYNDPATRSFTRNVDGDTVTYTIRVGQGRDDAVLVFTDVDVSPTGVADFALNGVRMSERIRSASYDLASSGIFSAVSYLSVDGLGVRAVLRVENRSAENLNLYTWDAAFVSSSGAQLEVATHAGPFTVRPGATAVIVVAFNAAGVSSSAGTIYLTGAYADGTAFEFVADLP